MMMVQASKWIWIHRLWYCCCIGGVTATNDGVYNQTAAVLPTSVALVIDPNALSTSSSDSSLVLSRAILNLAQTCTHMIALANNPDPPLAEEGYVAFGFHDEYPQQALVKAIDGYCVAALHGEPLTWDTWLNVSANLSRTKVTSKGEVTRCEVRSPFWSAYQNVDPGRFEQAVRDCAFQSCTNFDECVVLTGHSQGATMAAIAAIALADLNPYVITLAQPAAVLDPCPRIAPRRWYRFVNTVSSISTGILYDPVPFIPSGNAQAFGYLILLSDNDSDVASLGLNTQMVFQQQNEAGMKAHAVKSADGTGYVDRLLALSHSHFSIMQQNYRSDSDDKNGQKPFAIRTSGYGEGSFCSINEECQSGNCILISSSPWTRCLSQLCITNNDCHSSTQQCDSSGICAPKAGSCMSCQSDLDCMSGKCNHRHEQCASVAGRFDDQCYCQDGSECMSGRCGNIVITNNNATLGVCEARRPSAAICETDLDCASGICLDVFFICSKSNKISVPFVPMNKVTEEGRLVQSPVTNSIFMSSSLIWAVGLAVCLLVGLLEVINHGRNHRRCWRYSDYQVIAG